MLHKIALGDFGNLRECYLRFRFCYNRSGRIFHSVILRSHQAIFLLTCRWTLQPTFPPLTSRSCQFQISLHNAIAIGNEQVPRRFLKI